MSAVNIIEMNAKYNRFREAIFNQATAEHQNKLAMLKRLSCKSFLILLKPYANCPEDEFERLLSDKLNIVIPDEQATLVKRYIAYFAWCINMLGHELYSINTEI